LLAAAATIATFLVGEAVVALLVGSLALLSDAAHMLSDVAALLLAVVAARAARRPARGPFTYGFARVDALAGQASGVALVLLAVWFVIVGVRHLFHPPTVAGTAVIVVAAIGIVVNVVATWLAGRASPRSLNVRGAVAHLVTDAWAFATTLAAGIVIATTGWSRADAVASLVVAALMIWAAWGLLRDSGRVFLEGSPVGITPTVVAERLGDVPGVAALHDLHVWDLGAGVAALSAHVLVDPGLDCHSVGTEVRAVLRADFGIDHATLQTEHLDATTDPACVDLHRAR
jgi:cobalt-zinc-cadmium efflux system protein